MNKGKELAKNTIIIAIGKISTQFISFFLLPLYTAILTPNQYGIVDLFNTCIALCLPIITLQIEQAIFRYLIDVRDSHEGKQEIITISILFIITECLLYSFIFIILQKYLHIDFKWYIILNIIANAFSIMLLQVARGLGKMIDYSMGSFISAISTIGLNVIFLVLLKMGVEGMLLATFLGNLLCSSYLLVSLKVPKYINLSIFNKKRLKQMVNYSLPLVPHALSWWIVNASDRVIISTIIGVSANGIIAVAHKFPSVYTALFNVFNLSWTEAGALHLKEKDGQVFFEKTIQTIFNIFLAGFLMIVAIMPLVFRFLIDAKYNEAYNQIPIYMLASLFSMTVGLYNVVYTTYLDTKEIAKTTIIAGAINIFINFILIRFIGIYAASISSATAYGIMSVYRYFHSRRYVTLKLNNSIMISGSIITIFVLYIYYLRNTLLCISGLSIVFIYSIFINLGFIKDICLTVFKFLNSRFSST